MKKSRTIRGLAIGSIALLAVGCSSAQGESNADGPVELSFTWWGSDQRVANTEEVIAAFEEENPDITILPEYNDFRGYWDQLATRAAGGQSPDIMQMDLEYFREYAELGTLLELDEVDTSEIDDALLDQGFTEGGQFAVPTGFASVAVIANNEVFEQAGVELPDDTTWTWEDFESTAAEIQSSSDGVFGATTPFEPFAGVQAWLRQQDKELTTDEGEIGVQAQDLVEYFEHIQELDQAGALPPAEVIEEDRAAGADQSLIARGEMGMIFGYSNLFPVLSAEAGQELSLLRLPSPTGQAQDSGMWHRASMFLAAGANTEHPEEAQKFIDFFINSEASGLANLTDRGLPANTEVREAVVEELDGTEVEAAEFLNEIGNEISDASPVPPLGYGTVSETMHRYQSEVLFDRMSPEEAGEAAFAEIESNLG
ncbi:ABC transporter substrate-binding protein [Nesterenkonia halotolerans]|uniref:Multiple sugar transport system substrate-binding protein n=1 Tax=Nesterenkonia halotolerans TaxID=225325 RepID=A0ABR9J9Q0_9MICC|nr:extracellular solute-binding protein [Nesterenkonia halotolerans]MBE1515713.1 multiple sugar transport system substrate-binding protein [Nesterenkonia halotolerans]